MHHSIKKATLGLAGLAVAASFALAPAARAGSVPETPDPIKLAINEWTGQHITTHVAGEILKRMGYSVEYVTAGYYPQMTALEDDTITATLEIWSSNIGENYDKALATGNVIEIGDLGLEPREGWMYPKYVEAQCPGLPDWEALMKCAEVFATPETFPKGRFLDYPLDWGTTNVDRIKALGLDFVSVPSGGEGSLVAEIKSAVSRKDPLIMQFWAPHWLHAEVEMAIVNLPPHEAGCYDDASLGTQPERHLRLRLGARLHQEDGLDRHGREVAGGVPPTQELQAEQRRAECHDGRNRRQGPACRGGRGRMARRQRGHLASLGRPGDDVSAGR